MTTRQTLYHALRDAGVDAEEANGFSDRLFLVPARSGGDLRYQLGWFVAETLARPAGVAGASTAGDGDTAPLRWSAVKWKARRGRGVNWHLFAGGRSLCEAHLASLSDPYRPVSGKPVGDAGPCCDCLRVAADRDAVVPPVPATEEDGDA